MREKGSNPVKRLSKKTLFAYGCGDFASNLTNTFMGSYLSIFYTDVVGLAPAVVSMIMVIARVWDAINDPMFGAIAERTNTKKGRFRPYIFYFTPFLALAAVLTFTTMGGKGGAIYAAVTYIVYGMLYTVVNLSYGSLSTVMTTNPEDISQLTSWRMMGTNLSSVVLSALSPVIMGALSGGESFTAKSYLLTIIIYAACSIPLFYFVYANCKEVVKPVNDGQKVPLSMSLKAVVSNKPLMLVFGIQLFAMFAFFGRMGVVIYYIIYVMQKPQYISVFMALPSIMTVIGILLTKNYIVRWGKKSNSNWICRCRNYIDFDVFYGSIKSHTYDCIACTLWFFLFQFSNPDVHDTRSNQLSGRSHWNSYRWSCICGNVSFYKGRKCVWSGNGTYDHGSLWICGKCTAVG